MASSYTRPTMNCYEVLEISADATLKDINSAYKRLALKHHPDKAEGDDAAIEFRKIQEAVEILRDPTRRREHDKQFGPRTTVHSKEELLFTSPEYTGWRPKEMYRRYTNRRDRYTFSYNESVHMNPCSKESLEELARCQRAQEEEVQVREEINRAAETFAEDLAKEAERLRVKKQRAENRWFGWWNPEANAFKQTEDDHARTAAGVDTTKPANSLAGDTKSEVEAEGKPDSEPELNKASDNENFETESNPTADLDADSIPSTEADAGSEVEPVVGIELAEYYAEFDISDIAKPEDKVSEDTDVHEIIIDTENNSIGYSQIEEESNAGINKATEDHASVYTSPGRTTAEYVTASPGSLPHPNPSAYMMSGALVCSSNETPNNADTNSAGNAGDEDASIYYDFSDTPPADSKDEDDENSHGHSTDEDFDTSSTDDSPTPIMDDSKFDEANVYPYLAPFIPYFIAKLVHKDGQYTENDLQTELKGMVMETYCGWLETLRMAIPGVGPATLPDIHECRHLGYWKKELDHESCVVCDLWRPIYTLVCPGCGIRRCVGCKFQGIIN
ncbi:DnaJ domain-containing protein [Aspergillus spectabilis]